MNMRFNRQVTAALSAFLGLALTLAKVAVALLTGSLSILAEAMDAAMDLLSTGITLLAVRVADRPPDDDHPYGHARADHLGALGAATLMGITAVWVLWQAAQRIFVEPILPSVTVWSFFVVGISLGINLVRVLLLRRASEQSQSLAASAVNFGTDMIGSVLVLIALSLIAFSDALALPLWFVERADALAAALVALLALTLALRLGRHEVRALMDDVPPDLNRRLTYRIHELPDVLPDSARVRTRFIGSQPHVEVQVGTARGQSIEDAQRLMNSVQTVVRHELDQADVIVHVEAARTDGEPYATTVYAIAQELGLRVHNLDLYQLTDCVRVELDLELPGDMPLQQAHAYSERLEQAIRAELPACSTVAVHLEPRRDEVQPAVRYAPLTEQVRHAVASLPDAAMVVSSEALLTDSGTIVTLRCAFPGSMSLSDVHTAMEQIASDLYRLLPDVERVQIDPEPQDYLAARVPRAALAPTCAPHSDPVSSGLPYN